MVFTKKKKKEKKTTQIVEEKRSIITISVDEHLERIERHNLRLEAIQNFEEVFQEIKREYDKNIKLQKEALEWKKYVTCDEIPNVQHPTAVRTYLYKWLFEEWQIIRSAFTWVLDIDERSILTQNTAEPDLTRKRMEATVTAVTILGEICAYHIKNALQMMVDLCKLFDADTKNIYFDEFLRVKNEIQNRIRSCVDNLTYFILLKIDGNMKVIDTISEKYSNQFDEFSISLWSLRDVPIDFDKIDLTELLIELESIQSQVTLPMNIATENLVIRGLHLKFDHRSPNPVCWNLDNNGSLDEVEDFKTILVNEWQLRKKIEAKKLEEMRVERRQYEETIKAQEKESNKVEKTNLNKSIGKRTQNKRKPKSQERKKRKIQIAMEPPLVVTDETFLDIEKDFVQFNDSIYQNSNNGLKPENSLLVGKEINLREFIILGGVYELHFLEKPVQHRNSNSSYFSLKELPEKLRYKDVNCFTANNNLNSKPKSDTSSLEISPGRSEMIASAISEKELKYESLIRILIKLPTNLCRWCRPKACRWTTKSKTPDDSPNVKQPVKQFPTQLTVANLKKTVYYVIKNKILPRMGSFYKFPDELAVEREYLAVMANEADRLRREASMRMDEDEIGVGRISTAKSRLPSDKIIVEMNPPANLFPRSVSWNSTALFSSETLTDELSDQVTNMSTVEKKMLQVFLEDVDKQAEVRRAVFSAWWNLIRNKNGQLVASESEMNEDIDSNRGDQSTLLKPSLGKKKGIKMNRSKSRKSTTKESMVSLEKTGSRPEVESKISTEESSKPSKHFAEDEVYNTELGMWSTEHIFKEEFNDEKSEVTFWTDRLGVFGFAFKRYLHHPFKDWSICPETVGGCIETEGKNCGETIINDDPMWITIGYASCMETNPNPVNRTHLMLTDVHSGIIVLEIRSPFAHFAISVGEEGYKAKVTSGMKAYSELTKATDNLRIFQTYLQDLGLNIFADKDTSFYMSDMTEKHSALECNIYKTISQFCLRYKFCRSKWNWLAHRRNILLKVGTSKQQTYEMNTIRINPEESQFYTVTEKCTGLDEVILEYEPTGRNQNFQPNLYSLLCAYSSKPPPEHRPKIEMLVYNLLKAIRPLSFCK